MTRIFLLLLALAVPMAASAQQNCASYSAVRERLIENYQENVQSRGLFVGGQGILEIWANAETGTWTAVTIDPNGIACVRGSGEGFERVDGAPEPAGMTL